MVKPGTHNENRAVLYGVCYMKQHDLRQISANQLVQLQPLIESKYSLSEFMFSLSSARAVCVVLCPHLQFTIPGK